MSMILLSSLLTSTSVMAGSGAALATVLLIFYLISNEIIQVNKSAEELKRVFMPVVFGLLIVFVFTVATKVLTILV